MEHMNKHRRGGLPPGHVRIIGGSLRGSRLSVPTLPGLRPTPQRLRQTLFDWLTPMLDGARVLDLFAGSGALGIEALSRGAGSAMFFERNAAQARAIEADLVRLHQATARVRCTDALQELSRTAPEPFDIAFMDPPFDTQMWAPAAAALDSHGWLAPVAWVYVETGAGDAPELPARWRCHRTNEAGAVRGTLFRIAPS